MLSSPLSLLTAVDHGMIYLSMSSPLHPPSPVAKTFTSLFHLTHYMFCISCFILFVVITIVLTVTTHGLLFFLLCYLPFLVLYTIIADSRIHYLFCHCCCPSLSLFLFFFLYFSFFFCSNLVIHDNIHGIKREQGDNIH